MDIRGDIALIQSRLEARLAEGRGLTSQLERQQGQRDEARTRKKLLQGRVAELEEKAEQLQSGLAQVGGRVTMCQPSPLGEGLPGPDPAHPAGWHPG